MKITFPILNKEETQKTTKIIYKITEITWHTLIPITLTYLMIKYQQPLLIIGLITTIIIRMENQK